MNLPNLNIVEGLEDIFYNMIFDLRKKEIDPFTRAKAIRYIMKKKNLSIRRFAIKFDLNKSTVEDWLLYERINQKTYKKMKANGLSKTDIYRTLRDNKKEEDIVFMKKTKVDLELINIIKIMKAVLHEPHYSIETKNLIFEVRNLLNLLEMNLDKKIRGGE